MQKELAQRLLSATLNWSGEDIEKYSNVIDNFAELKFDEYQQYKPGSRFVENLCSWLNQFSSNAERETALNFILNKLVFVSISEMHRLIETVYHEKICPLFFNQATEIVRNNPELITLKEKISEIIKTKSIFLAMSDGARIDVLRRTAQLAHDQVCVDYDLSELKYSEIRDEMKNRVELMDPERKISGCIPDGITHVFLLDDFSGSGISYLRHEGNDWKGKISKVLNRLKKECIISPNSRPQIHIILYLATPRALNHIQNNLENLCQTEPYKIDIQCVQMVNSVELNDKEEALFSKYYLNVKSEVEDSHYGKGDMSNPHHGFDGCSLPLVLYHNTPNNTFPIIWAGNHALFPRVTRHKDVR